MSNSGRTSHQDRVVMFRHLRYTDAMTGFVLKIVRLLPLLVLSASAVHGQGGPTQNQADAWQEFKQTHGEGWTASWSSRTGAPDLLFGGTTKAYHGSSVEVATAFLAQHASLFRMKPSLDDLTVARTRKSTGITHVVLQQTHHAIPVDGALLGIHIDMDGRIVMVNGDYYPNINVSPEPEVSSDEAITVAQNLCATKYSGYRLGASSDLAFRPLADVVRLVWKVRFDGTREGEGALLCFVDASNGQIVEDFVNEWNVTGEGNVFTLHDQTCLL